MLTKIDKGYKQKFSNNIYFTMKKIIAILTIDNKVLELSSVEVGCSQID